MTHHVEDLVVRGVKVRLRRAGSGTPLLFLHGAGGVMRWLPFFDRLAENHTLLVPDHPGFGDSDDPKWIRTVADLGFFYLDLLEQLDLQRVDVVGHSLGGWLASEIAIRDSSRLRAVSLLAPAGIRVNGDPMGDPFIWGPEEFVRNLYVNQKLADAQLAAVPTPEEADVLLKNRFAFAKLGWQPRMHNPDLEKWLHRVKVPAQVIWGDSDKLIPASYAAQWGRVLPRAQVHVLKDCGHIPQVEQLDETTALVQRFLAGVQA